MRLDQIFAPTNEKEKNCEQKQANVGVKNPIDDTFFIKLTKNKRLFSQLFWLFLILNFNVLHNQRLSFNFSSARVHCIAKNKERNFIDKQIFFEQTKKHAIIVRTFHARLLSLDDLILETKKHIKRSTRKKKVDFAIGQTS